MPKATCRSRARSARDTPTGRACMMTKIVTVQCCTDAGQLVVRTRVHKASALATSESSGAGVSGLSTVSSRAPARHLANRRWKATLDSAPSTFVTDSLSESRIWARCAAGSTSSGAARGVGALSERERASLSESSRSSSVPSIRRRHGSLGWCRTLLAAAAGAARVVTFGAMYTVGVREGGGSVAIAAGA